MKIFLSFHFDKDRPEYEQLVHRVRFYLRKQKDIHPYSYSGSKTDEKWRCDVGPPLIDCDKFVFFLGSKIGDTQKSEYQTFINRHPVKDSAITIQLPNACILPDDLFEAAVKTHTVFEDKICDLGKEDLSFEEVNTFEKTAQMCARKIVRYFAGDQSLRWVPPDGLPIGYPFSYEKTIIGEFVAGKGRLLSPERLAEGCPIMWPKVGRRESQSGPLVNPIPESKRGKNRSPDASVLVDVRGQYHLPRDAGCSLAKHGLTFPEAGPRKELFRPPGEELRVGIVVSGGIAPGINSVVSGIIQRHRLYEKYAARKGNEHEVTFIAYQDGFAGIAKGRNPVLGKKDIRGLTDAPTLGGSALSTSRYDDLLEICDCQKRENFLTNLVKRLDFDKIDILYVVGGDGSMRAAHAISTRVGEMRGADDNNRRIRREISVVAIPKTVDNDVLWVWQTFGFSSAVEKAKEFILQLSTEARSNPRLCIAQLFGSDSGYLVSHAALASGACLAALVPEVNFTMKGLSRHICDVLKDQLRATRTEDAPGKSPHGVVLLGESAIPLDVEDYIDSDNYPGLILEEEEKQCIRKFMGSALLNMEDIHWESIAQDLCDCEESHEGLGRQLWNGLPSEVKAILRTIRSDLAANERLKSLVLVALNQLLKSHNIWAPQNTEQSSDNTPVGDLAKPPGAQKIADVIKHIDKMCSGQAKFPVESLQKLFDDLAFIPVSCDAKEMLAELERRSKEEKNDSWQKLQRQENQPLVEAIRKRLTERFNRLMLEAVITDKTIARCRTPLGTRRIQGQTPDALRTGGLKIVAHVLQNDIRRLCPSTAEGEYWRSFRVFKNEPRHLIRAITPNAPDVIFGHRLGVLAVDNAMAGYTDFMISQWLTEYVLVPLELVVLGRKRVPRDGIFWKSVLASTGQPDMI